MRYSVANVVNVVKNLKLSQLVTGQVIEKNGRNIRINTVEIKIYVEMAIEVSVHGHYYSPS